MKKITNILRNRMINILFLILVTFLLGISIRGQLGNPNSNNLNTISWKENGPFELSPERGRFALTYSLVENKSFQFTDEIGKFVMPDVAVLNGKFVSLFAPLISVIIIPGYFIGKMLGISQVGSYFIIALFALFNTILIRLILSRLGMSNIASILGSFVFLFCTPAFAYAVNLYQHHVSTFLILLSVYVLLKSQKVWSIAIVFFACGISLSIDYPNLFFMFPLGIFGLLRIINIEKIKEKVKLKINIFNGISLFVFILPIVIFMSLNYLSYGNPFQLAGTLPSAEIKNNLNTLESKGNANVKKEESKKSAVGFFDSRYLLNGFYIHFISPDRGVIYYAPVILFGFAGLVLAYKKKIKIVSLLVAIMGANILLYSMWGDPWGGWAFGSRYLIPTYAILSIFCGIVVNEIGKKIIFIIPFFVVGVYSITVNTLGAITTSALPPKVQVLELEKISGIVQRYTYQRNWELLLAGNSKSFVFQTFLKDKMTALQFYEILVGLIVTIFALLLILFYVNKKTEVENV